MIKIIDPASFAFHEPVAMLVELHSRGPDKDWMTKRAALFTKEIAALRPEPGHSFIHMTSLGAGETYSTNRNGDYFNEAPTKFPLPFPKDASVRELDLVAGLVNTHPTFLQGHVFKHHRNDNPAGAIGKIAAQAYNHDMHRGELIIKVPHGREWDADLQKIASGGQVPFSMAVRVPTDFCSSCGNRARSRAEYCEHLRDHLTDIIKTGHQIFAVNDEG